MPYVLVQVKFEDYAKWKSGFAEAGTLRKAYSSKGVRVFRNTAKPNEAVIVGEYQDLERARQLFQSAEFRQATQRAGVVGTPEVTFLDEVDQLPA
ncbi:MAG: cyclase [Chloroflexi bacterium]|nr:cyclase [Chloroflexota bacterium]